MSAGSSSNLFRLTELTNDQGAVVVRKIFDETTSNVPLHQFLSQENETIQTLRGNGVITKVQYDLLFPRDSNPPTTADLDFNLGVCLLRNLNACGLNPNFNWNDPPQPGDTSMEADLRRLEMFKNELAHSVTGLDTFAFIKKWIDIEQVLVRLNGSLQKPIPNIQQCFDHLIAETDDEAILLWQEREKLEKEMTEREEKQNHAASASQKGSTHSTDQTGSDKATKWTQDVNAWKMCIERNDKKEAERLICERILPDQEMLNKASTSFGSDLQVLNIICDEICSYIKAESNKIINVYAGYKHAGHELVEENALVFAVITTSKLDVENKFGYKLEQICIHEVNSSLENKAITLKERQNPANKDEIIRAEKVITSRSQELMKNHKNITRISVSWIKSSRYGTDDASMDREVCISLYVPKKGLIPIDENSFPSKLDIFPVDVREGVCIPFLGPNDLHDNIKIGCAISGPCKGKIYNTGTLGGIFEIGNQVYGLTCAHLFLLNPNLQVALKKKGYWNAPATQDPSSNNVYQPTPHYGAFGSLKQAVLLEGDKKTSGVDAAYFDFQNRHPNSGLFPDDNINGTTGFDENNPMEFKFGKLSEKVNLDDSVVKFGSSTCRTNGIVRACAGTFRVDIPHIGERSFNKQYEIISSDTDTTFAACGDSGAMVFTVEDKELLGIGIVEGGSPDVCFVTPICDVLSALGVNPPYKMKKFVLDTGKNKKDTTCSEHAIFNKRDNSDQGWSQDLSKQMNETSIKNDQ